MKTHKITAILVLIALLITGCANSNVPADETTEPTLTDNIDKTPGEGEGPTPSPTEVLPLHGLKICIDPGHQGKANNELEEMAPWSSEKKRKIAAGTKGATTGTPEYMLTLKIGLKLRDALMNAGAEVLMTRETHDVDISNKERALMSNEFGSHLTLRIHLNGVDNKDVHGMEIYIRDKGDGSEETKALANYELAIANMLMEKLVNATGAANRNVRRSDNYTSINWTEGPCMILELGYLTNEEEEKKLVSDEYQDTIVNAIVEFLKENDVTKR
ncbi:MAG TPA: N-acetylmuramoyl-L-alanine amidase [Clostridia bacterium]|nr:N-acetylmuramoyl-L-alanine amidase [Clostridiaceae bacterium]HOA32420.1 N-acetylmuramoyl-L-alanine amidase [Clostridia bacterium]HPZ52258.1 N-acetylmuramoyl-L-alanine amidase [Clostridia bacterium]